MKRLTTLCVINEVENGEPQLQNKRGKHIFLRRQLFMRKKTIFLIMMMMMLIAFSAPAFSVPAFADTSKDSGNNGNQSTPTTITPTLSYPLHQGVGPFDWKGYLQGSGFGINEVKGEDRFIPGIELGTKDTVLWHFVTPDKLGGYANITFLDATGNEVTFKNVNSYKDNQHFAVITFQSWKLISAEYFPEIAPDKLGTQFNLSHTAIYYGELKVTVDVNKQHDEVTLQQFYERDVQYFYERNVQDFYKRNVQDFYKRDVQNFYKRESHNRYVPVFEKRISNNPTSTLTSRLGNNVGGIFRNGMIWLEIDVAKARSMGYTFGIAQSNPDNTYIGYDYNVRIKDNTLILSFDDRFIMTKMTAKVYNTAPNKHDNSDHVTLGIGESFVVNLPNGFGDKVYLYVHFANGISWYTTGEYEFVEWRYNDTIFGDYMLVDTMYGDYVLIKTEIGEYELVNTVYGDYRLVDIVYGDYMLIETIEVERKTLTDTYDVKFDLIVYNADGEPVFISKILNNSEVIIPKLIPGNYTVIISGDDIDEQIKHINVLASEIAEVNFNDIPTIIGEQVDIYLDNVENDNILEDIKNDNKLEDNKTDNKLEDFKEDNQLSNIYYPDIILPDVKLGNETDPYDENAIRLN